jgi:peptidoglycan/xylan/chitin deacetylase (PgdA/CDA1 family)
MIRTRVKTAVAGVLGRTGMDKVVGSLSGAGNVPAVIAYHRVVEDFASSAETSIPSMLVSLQMLERHLDWIGRRFRFVSLDELGSILEAGDRLRKPVAAITFDDGYRDFYFHALPLLQKKGIPAALFVVTDFLGTKRVQTHDKLYVLLMRRFGPHFNAADLDGLLQRLSLSLTRMTATTPFHATRLLLEAFPQADIQRLVALLESEVPISEDTLTPFYSLTWEMLAAVHRAGITVGSHTRTHALMTNESRHKVSDEVTGSREELEARLGVPVQHFAYPSGLFNTSSVNAVAAARYRYGYTTCTHRDSRHPMLTVPRSVLWENSCQDSGRSFSPDMLSCQIHRAFDWMSGCRQRHTANQQGVNDRA